MIKNKIIVILGPTSSGKSDIAIKLAKKFSAKGGSAFGGNGAEIISADSRQIYRGLDIGTGKVCGTWNVPACRRGRERKSFISENIPHYLIDIVSPRTNYSAAEFKKDADKIIKDVLKRGKVPIICGGTGFWIKAIVDNVVYPEVKPDWKLRDDLNKKPAEELFFDAKKTRPRSSKNN